MTKAELRASLRERRRWWVDEMGSNKFEHCVGEILHKLFENRYKSIASYRATANECDITSVLIRHWSGNIALPWVNAKSDELVFRMWKADDKLEKSSLGFMQPKDSAQIVKPDVILAPLLGFDANLARLGQGAGHYDRAFVRFPKALRIGIAWSVQQVDELPTDPWDVPLDAVITENALHSGTNSRLKI